MKLFLSEIRSEPIILPKEESFHLAKVLRVKVGEEVFVTNGTGTMVKGKVVVANEKQSVIQTAQKWESYQKREYRLHIAISPPKSMDRFEFFLEKSVEFGIDEITPLQCFHSERKVLNLNRSEKIIQSAVKQSLKAYFPKLNPVISFKEFIKNQNTKNTFLAHCNTNYSRTPFKEILKNQKDIVVMIGPEGDFSEQEIQLANQQKIQPISLGKNRLRTETAAVQIASIFNWEYSV